MSTTYRLMIHFAIATMHFYREDIIPLKEGEPLEIFADKNKDLIERVRQEAINLFQYELSHEQICRAIVAYFAKARSLKNTEPAVLS